MHGAFELCPGMVITGLLLAAEAMLFSMPPSDRNPLQEAKGYLQFLWRGRTKAKVFDNVCEFCWSTCLLQAFCAESKTVLC